MVEYLLLFIAGLLGGIVNTIAGGGSFITFPALIYVGVPPLIANATNTFSSCAGYLSGAYGLRRQLQPYIKEILVTGIIGIFGGLLGALLLLNTNERFFEKAIPWLLLFATFIFSFGPTINMIIIRYKNNHKDQQAFYVDKIKQRLLLITLILVCIYGGFFNAGLGIIILSYLILQGQTNINVMNGLKLIISTAVSLSAIIMFITHNAIAWREGGIVMIGTSLGGYFSALMSISLPEKYIRALVIAIGGALTAYFFYKM